MKNIYQFYKIRKTLIIYYWSLCTVQCNWNWSWKWNSLPFPFHFPHLFHTNSPEGNFCETVFPHFPPFSLMWGNWFHSLWILFHHWGNTIHQFSPNFPRIFPNFNWNSPILPEFSPNCPEFSPKFTNFPRISPQFPDHSYWFSSFLCSFHFTSVAYSVSEH